MPLYPAPSQAASSGFTYDQSSIPVNPSAGQTWIRRDPVTNDVIDLRFWNGTYWLTTNVYNAGPCTASISPPGGIYYVGSQAYFGTIPELSKLNKFFLISATINYYIDLGENGVSDPPPVGYFDDNYFDTVADNYNALNGSDYFRYNLPNFSTQGSYGWGSQSCDCYALVDGNTLGWQLYFFTVGNPNLRMYIFPSLDYRLAL